MGRANLRTERLDVLNPSLVLLEAIGRETDKLHATGSEVRGTASDFTKLSSANRCKVIYKRALVSSWRPGWRWNPTGMGEENGLCARWRWVY